MDRKPQMPAERARIEAAGGTIVNARGTFRVDGILAVSRALGGFRCRSIVIASSGISTASSHVYSDNSYRLVAW